MNPFEYRIRLHQDYGLWHYQIEYKLKKESGDDWQILRSQKTADSKEAALKVAKLRIEDEIAKNESMEWISYEDLSR